MPVFDTKNISLRQHIIVVATCFLGRLNLILARTLKNMKSDRSIWTTAVLPTSNKRQFVFTSMNLRWSLNSNGDVHTTVAILLHIS
jgi:hypothetical protein